jgi:hypothetical protein
MGMKKNFYIALFTLLGVLLSFLIHGVVEIWYIGLLLSDFSRWGFGFAWSTWVMIHNVAAVVLFIAGLYAGFRHGQYWWRRIYRTT